MNQRKLSRYLLWMALIATLVSAYEFCTRVDAMWKPLKMFWNMAVGEKIPLARAATYVDMSIFEIPLYLLCSVALGIWALWARRTRRGCALLIAPSAVLAALGFILPLTLAGKWVRAVRLLPMIVLCALSVARVAIREPERQRRPHDQRPLPPERGPRPLPMPADTPEERQRVKRRYRRAS